MSKERSRSWPEWADALLFSSPSRSCYDHALQALDELLATPLLAGLTITELNPDHTELGANNIENFTTAPQPQPRQVAAQPARSIGAA